MYEIELRRKREREREWSVWCYYSLNVWCRISGISIFHSRKKIYESTDNFWHCANQIKLKTHNKFGSGCWFYGKPNAPPQSTQNRIVCLDSKVWKFASAHWYICMAYDMEYGHKITYLFSYLIIIIHCTIIMAVSYVFFLLPTSSLQIHSDFNRFG